MLGLDLIDGDLGANLAGHDFGQGDSLPLSTRNTTNELVADQSLLRVADT